MKEAYTSMKEALSPLSLYSFENSNISYELQTYSDEINRLNKKTLEMLFECFIDTASTYGIENREIIIGALRDDLTLQKRRQMLNLRESIDQKSFTVEQINKSLKSFSLENFKVYEYPKTYTIVVDALGSYTDAQKAWIRSQILKIMPAHQVVYVVFNGPSWEQSDSKNNDFTYIDSLNLRWEDIDNLE
ncbi:MAG: DUF2313 domain-containing protein [Ruminococcus sp.]|nr:DUF2313 domain-containing protein [Ruminococcus sp.]